MASWSSAEEPCAHAWGPAGLPHVVEYYTPPTDIFGNTAASFQQYYNTSSSIGGRQQQQQLLALGESYTVPRVVAIGPNYHDREDLMAVEEVKRDALGHCFPLLYDETHDAALREAKNVRYLYGKDEVKVADDVFGDMILNDACFLVQFMLTDAGSNMYDFFKSNKNNILHDIMLLENQIPWQVVESGSPYHREPVRFDRFPTKPPRTAVTGLTGPVYRYRRAAVRPSGSVKKPLLMGRKSVDLGVFIAAWSDPELGDMGLFYKMGVSSRGVFFAELSMAPLPLDNTRASWLANMAALELCTTPDFLDTYCEDSTVCSYLRLLCMLVQKEADVDLLRTEGILQGGAMLTNQEALRLLTNLHSYLRLGCYYGRVMVEIDHHKLMWWIRVCAFGYRHWKKGFAIISAGRRGGVEGEHENEMVGEAALAGVGEEHAHEREAASAHGACLGASGLPPAAVSLDLHWKPGEGMQQ
ncbi:hypothetical protein HU200_066263 [Digitaria exilis]|uniref:Uncharacterized protein n=1 Tax=Digitaria exilis TaxID=1010633 RepID=A0A835A6U5_9POAL|nr:hypothetical protein HU200_066263 [Digitaria exilis]